MRVMQAKAEADEDKPGWDRARALEEFGDMPIALNFSENQLREYQRTAVTQLRVLEVQPGNDVSGLRRLSEDIRTQLGKVRKLNDGEMYRISVDLRD